MSSDLPESASVSPPSNQDADILNAPPSEPKPTWQEWTASGILVCATMITTSFAGLFYATGEIRFLHLARAAISEPRLILLGLPFSIPLLTILLAHEMGHYAACRYYGIRCTPPYFIPVPIPIAGTFGAFIKIRSQFVHRRALFDVGIAGPLAGLLFVLPTLWAGISLSKLIPKGFIAAESLSFGEPLLFRLMGELVLDYSPARQDMLAHPMAMAGWFGLLATSLNLLPIWQLDGGHIAYAVFGRRFQKRISVFALAILVLVSFWGWPTPSYLLFALLVLIMGARFHFYHPPTLIEEENLGPGRLVLGLIALVALIMSFTPVPISFT